MKKKYALVIGGTGMLEEVCHWLVENDYFISVINRSLHKFEEMKNKNSKPKNFHPITVDYHNYEQLQNKIKSAFHTYGCPDLVVSWIHPSAPDALSTIMQEFEGSSSPWKLLHIQGSSSFFVKENTPVPESCEYRRVYLGFVKEDTGTRWLTHKEVANGIIKVIQKDYKETVVGTLKPWNLRPDL